VKKVGALSALAVFALTGLALASSTDSAAASLRVIGKGTSGSSSGEFAVTVARGSKKKANALYIRGYGRDLSGHAVVTCSRGLSIGSKSKSFDAVRSGQLYRLPLPFAGDCEVTASLSGFGRIRLEILA
jgi:hypothetical protein